jgi:hypothetical protein
MSLIVFPAADACGPDVVHIDVNIGRRKELTGEID